MYVQIRRDESGDIAYCLAAQIIMTWVDGELVN